MGGEEDLESAQRRPKLSVSVLEWVRTKILILMRQPVDRNVLAELEEIEIEFWMNKYKRYDNSFIHMAWYSQFVLKVSLNTDQPTNL